MQVPLHPTVVHFPIAISLLMPFLVLAFAYMLRLKKMAPQGWLVIIFLQLGVVASGYWALETGDTDEHIVEKAISKKLIHAHEEAAKIFVGASVLVLVLVIGVYFIREDLQFYVHLAIVLMSLIATGLAWRAGRLGGELVYLHGAGSVHSINQQTTE